MNDVSSQRRVHLLQPAPSTTPLDKVERLSAENAVVVFSTSGCCMSHVVKSLFCGLGVNPLVYELDQEKDGPEIEAALGRFTGNAGTGGSGGVSPTVFVGGKLVGGLDQVMAAHINGSLVPRLKEAGALWL